MTKQAILMREGRHLDFVERLYRLTEPYDGHSWVNVWRLGGEMSVHKLWWALACDESGVEEANLGTRMRGKTPEEALAKLGYQEVVP